MNIKEMLSSSNKNIIQLALDIITKNEGVTDEALRKYNSSINNDYMLYIIDNKFILKRSGIWAQLLQNPLHYKSSYDLSKIDINRLKNIFSQSLKNYDNNGNVTE